jgi:hypothetical protein
LLQAIEAGCCVAVALVHIRPSHGPIVEPFFSVTGAAAEVPGHAWELGLARGFVRQGQSSAVGRATGAIESTCNGSPKHSFFVIRFDSNGLTQLQVMVHQIILFLSSDLIAID